MRLPASHIRILFTYVFFRREISAVLSVFFLFGSYFRVVSAECVLCVVRCFFLGVCVLFFDSGFV